MRAFQAWRTATGQLQDSARLGAGMGGELAAVSVWSGLVGGQDQRCRLPPSLWGITCSSPVHLSLRCKALTSVADRPPLAWGLVSLESVSDSASHCARGCGAQGLAHGGDMDAGHSVQDDTVY